jgi:tetrahydromethanopterin S-methyltransferase subunit G
MTFTIAVSWWAVPIVITLLSIVLPFVLERGGDTIFRSIKILFNLVIGLAVSVLAWIVFAFLK